MQLAFCAARACRCTTHPLPHPLCLSGSHRLWTAATVSQVGDAQLCGGELVALQLECVAVAAGVQILADMLLLLCLTQQQIINALKELPAVVLLLQQLFSASKRLNNHLAHALLLYVYLLCPRSGGCPSMKGF